MPDLTKICEKLKKLLTLEIKKVLKLHFSKPKIYELGATALSLKGIARPSFMPFIGKNS